MVRKIGMHCAKYIADQHEEAGNRKGQPKEEADMDYHNNHTYPYPHKVYGWYINVNDRDHFAQHVAPRTSAKEYAVTLAHEMIHAYYWSIGRNKRRTPRKEIYIFRMKENLRDAKYVYTTKSGYRVWKLGK